MTEPLTALLVTLALGAPVAPASPNARMQGVAAFSDEAARERLWQLLTASVSENAPKPTSPRYLALARPGLRGFRLFLGWSLPHLADGDDEVLSAVASTLGGDDGWLAARIVRARKADAVNVWFERREGGAWFGIEITGSTRSATKELELMVLETLAVLEAHAPPAVETAEPKADVSPPGLSPAFVGRSVRRLLSPISRAVVEVQPPDPPDVRRVSKAPVRHVVERGDTLTHIARKNGLDLDALVQLNGIDPDRPIHPGDELRVSDKRARRPKLYVVKQGDTLAKVARRFGVSEARLLEVNRLKVRRVEAGQKLVLPQ